MHRLRKITKSTFIAMLVFLQIFATPAIGFADTATVQPVPDPVDSSLQTKSTESATAPVKEPTNVVLPPNNSEVITKDPPAQAIVTGPTAVTGPSQPNGAASATYHQNPDGTWENDLYLWDPTTGLTKPKTPQTYSFNPVTKLWDTTEWYFSPEAGKYLPNVVSLAQVPQQKVTTLPKPNSGASISQTGPSSNNNILLGGTNTGTFDKFFDARISNAIGQMSRTGNAGVQGNTIGGSASSGDAQSIANLLNLLQSSWGTLGSEDISSFVANIDGDMVGDLLIDPSLITSGSGNTKLDINVAKNGQINNDVNLNAVSGNASVGGNTVGGNAQSGKVSAVANLLNLINSAINAKKSFVGVLNINGNFEGDILLPPGLLQSIIASSGPNSNNTIKDQGNTNLNVGVNTNRSIINDVSTDASSGKAIVGNNTSGGTAVSGNADNNVTLLNLTGRKVVARDALLVFVNVFGKWVGLIMDAPAGSNAVAATGPGSNNTIDSQHNANININSKENSQIRNNIRTSAHSGDASVTGNTVGGNASSGDAFAGANILNLIDSSFDISDWFGVLFINVFGTWHGSFGVDTPYGNPAVANSSGVSGGGAAVSGATPTTASKTEVFSFIPKVSGQAAANNTTTQVAAATTVTKTNSKTSAAANSAQASSNTASLAQIHAANWTWTFVGISSALTILGLERYLTLRRRRLV